MHGHKEEENVHDERRLGLLAPSSSKQGGKGFCWLLETWRVFPSLIVFNISVSVPPCRYGFVPCSAPTFTLAFSS
eukprot:CAMPEP_0206615148 /NCGR_PEP_ID=MMETSP0325_2-20121206/57921_1 /ASSEMBLY_ACC=CAM_ASM_000347 /TAXON_ID=2866 /ORGANISM="Crypthecodinium cohnii, Strain Seligo" /LENGTH=74 /DNA_ID=CAMNT_0054135993 /DNA_START=91 /DNA_END=311 /DNA_ORIENTATION=+